MTPYKIRSQSVRVRRSLGPEFAVPSSFKQFSFSLRTYGSHPAPLWNAGQANSGNHTAPRHAFIRLYSIVSILTVCAILPACATAKLFTGLRSAAPDFRCHILPCPLGQVAKSTGRYLLPHALSRNPPTHIPPPYSP